MKSVTPEEEHFNRTFKKWQDMLNTLADNPLGSVSLDEVCDLTHVMAEALRALGRPKNGKTN